MSACAYVNPSDGRVVRTIVAASLVEKVMGLRGVAEFAEVGRCKGRVLEGARYRHIFIDRTSPIVLAGYVSAEDGTGFVHTAPGHGAEDYRTGQEYGLPTLSPVDASGRYTSEAPEFLVGKTVWAANPLVVETVREAGTLFHELPLIHSYPHCWRCKKPVIFRATEQWFVAVDHDDLREKTLNIINNDVRWLPSWGESRIEAMVSTRPDWCISRQRSWGVPIPAFGCESCGTQLLTAESVRHVRDLFRAEGADAWFRKPVEELLPPGALARNAGGRPSARRATSSTSGSSRAPAIARSWTSRATDLVDRPRSCTWRAPISIAGGSSRRSSRRSAREGRRRSRRS